MLRGRRRFAVVSGFVVVAALGVASLSLAHAWSSQSIGSRGRSTAVLLAERQAALRSGRKFEFARDRWLRSATARRQRSASRVEFRRLSSAAAELVLERVFGRWLPGRDATPSGSLAGVGRVIRYVGKHEAVVATRLGRKVAISNLPFVVSRGRARPRPLDLNLHRTVGGFVPANPLSRIVIGTLLDDGVAVGETGLRFALQGRRSAGRLVNRTTAFFGDVATDTDATETVTPRGVELSALLRSPRSPQRLRYAVKLPHGASLRAGADGAVEVARGKRVLDEILPPVAMDAQHTAVPVSMRVTGSSLIVAVSHRSGDFAYPILVDPQVIASADLGMWGESGYISPFDAGLYDVGDPFDLIASGGKYVFGGGVEGATWTWVASAPVAGAVGPATWWFYDLTLVGDSANVESAGIYVGGCNGTAPHGLISTQPGQIV